MTVEPDDTDQARKQRLALRFRLLDADGDGVLTFEDFELLAGRLIRTIGYSETAKKAKAVREGHRRYWLGISGGDASGARRVTFDEYAAIIHDEAWFEAHLRPYAEAVAAIVDINSDGLIQKNEFRICMQAVGFDEWNVEELFAALDQNGDGTISPEEWMSTICKYYISDAPNLVGDLILKGTR